MTLRVYISGGPNRKRFSSGLTQTEEAKKLHAQFPQVDFVKSGQTDFVVIDDENGDGPSESALKTLKEGGKVMKYTAFVKMMRRKSRKNSKKKSAAWSGHADTLTGQMENVQLEDKEQEQETNTIGTVIPLFVRYALRMYMFIAMEASDTAMVIPAVKEMCQFLVKDNNEKLNQAWMDYVQMLQVIYKNMKIRKENQSCDDMLLQAQRQLGLKSNAIVTNCMASNVDVAKLMDFFTNHDEQVLAMMLGTSINSSAMQSTAFDELVTSVTQFALSFF